ncbi:MAG: 4Fe-4S dicluster domain-containing protein [Crenarchaeota archaeon]|nr:4Fe-4S dicluster domain-containing protein [Thermoproteota archaeon]
MRIAGEVLRNLFRKPATIQYPKQQTQIEPDARGRHFADLKKCIGCSLCAMDCPSKAIVMKKLPEDKKPPQNRRGLYPVINYLNCIYCYRCVTICPVKAYVTSSEYRLATESKVLTSEELSLSTLSR